MSRSVMIHRICQISLIFKPTLSEFVKENDARIKKFFSIHFRDHEMGKDFVQTFWLWMFETYCRGEDAFQNANTQAGQDAVIHSVRGRLWSQLSNLSRSPIPGFNDNFETVMETDLFKTKTGDLDAMYAGPVESRPDIQLMINDFLEDLFSSVDGDQYKICLAKFFGHNSEDVMRELGMKRSTYYWNLKKVEGIMQELREKHFGVKDEVVHGASTNTVLSNEVDVGDQSNDVYETSHVASMFE